ncbi:hypothetical protein BJV78DRAFT_1360962 [Lactifluus subvellereus]|nr:hypothetical protein BJV78DRAFT_1360962 [Lactifluus subvellereus]
MSDSEQDASGLLGKRARNGPGSNIAEDVDMNPPSATQVDDESDDDVGPMPMPEDRYHKSFMHRDVINFVVVTRADFVITTSVDGHLKLWKKQETGIEFGRDDTVRWMNLSLYQGAPAKKGITTVAMAASANPILADKAVRDPTLFCTGLKRQHFYMFTRSEPEDSSSKSDDRDIFNERPTREEQSIVAAAAPAAASRAAALVSTTTIHTTLGDMFLHLFPQQAPKAVENFIGHARRARIQT